MRASLVVEKSEFIGGTTAVSGGDMWIPNNHHIAGRDSREEAIAYVTRLSDGRAADPSLIEVYVDTAPLALDYLEAHTGYRTEPHVSLDDYYSVIGDRLPGVKRFPRTCSCQPYPAVAELGSLACAGQPGSVGQAEPRSASRSSGGATSIGRNSRGDGARAGGPRAAG